MSYDVKLVDAAGETIQLPQHQLRGGTYQVGGTTQAWLNITYNYSRIIGRVLPGGIRGLYGQTAARTMPALAAAIAQLDDDTCDDYWQATEGNVKRALLNLLALAQQAPLGVWQGD